MAPKIIKKGHLVISYNQIIYEIFPVHLIWFGANKLAQDKYFLEQVTSPFSLLFKVGQLIYVCVCVCEREREREKL